jgi:hypothetical protein
MWDAHRNPFPPPRGYTWLVVNIAGAALFILLAWPLWFTPGENSDSATLLYEAFKLLPLVGIFSLFNVGWLLWRVAVATRAHAWAPLRDPAITLTIWAMVLWYHHVRISM